MLAIMLTANDINNAAASVSISVLSLSKVASKASRMINPANALTAPITAAAG